MSSGAELGQYFFLQTHNEKNSDYCKGCFKLLISPLWVRLQNYLYCVAWGVKLY